MPIDVTVKDGIATVVINRPEAMNSIDPDTRQELYKLWDRIRDDDDIHVVVISGAGDRAFCTGADLKKTFPPKESFAELFFGRNNPGNITHGFGADKPIIAAVNGYAMGGGMELALACDICIASERAKFALSEVRVGSIPGSGGVQRLPRTIGKSDAMLLLLTGDTVDAHEAMRMGFVSKVVPHGEILSAALDIARRIAANAPLAVRMVKRLVTQGMEMPLVYATDLDRYLWGLIRDTDDRIEGRKAFSEKRKPAYKGR
jgi:(E)-benzylidenesuccinyl-CoA hydratase